MISDHLVLAGGGHTHALILHRWAMKPKLKPKGLITLINRSSSTLYSAMFPGIIAGKYKLEEALINIRLLADQAGIAFVANEITGLNLNENLLYLENRPPVHFTKISLDIGSETFAAEKSSRGLELDSAIAIKPFQQALDWIENQDNDSFIDALEPLTVIGSGLSGVEIVFALRKRWPNRLLSLQANFGQPNVQLKRALLAAGINIIPRDQCIRGPAIRCTGSDSPKWIKQSGLPLGSSGRVLTNRTLQVVGHPNFFAVGDCGVIKKNFRPPSGVWAVREALPLAKNLERASCGLPLISWRPQPAALQLMGGYTKSNISVAWAFYGWLVLGPSSLLCKLKEFLDKRFMEKFEVVSKMRQVSNRSIEIMACRGCAAKVGEKSLKEALKRANLPDLANHPEDSSLIFSTSTGHHLVQSVDGFPALVSDPWLNGRLTALHACSDLWASGASVISAQSVVTLPAINSHLQEELLSQTLAGIQSALEPQGAQLLGGHSLEARSLPPEPSSLGIQIALSVNGRLASGQNFWKKSGLKMGDVILISRGLGSGVLFAAAMAGRSRPHDLDNALNELSLGQYKTFELLIKKQKAKGPDPLVHACTDITGFGLLGHLGEMIRASNAERRKIGLHPLRIQLDATSIPALEGVPDLVRAGISSTLAPANRNAWRLLDQGSDSPAAIDLKLGGIHLDSPDHKGILELIVDPQTCGPLLITCSCKVAEELVISGPWRRIGKVISPF